MSEAWELWRRARRLGRRGGGRKSLPPLLAFTDPKRTPDPAALAARLPRGAGVVFRAFGAADAPAQGRRLARVCRVRGLVLLVGADAAQAARLHADGVHLPQRLARRAGDIARFKRRFLVTAAAHDLPAALAARRAGVDAIVVSPVFASASPSAGAPIGPHRLAILVRRLGAKVYALGGVNSSTIRTLRRTGIVGIAAVEALAGQPQTRSSWRKPG